MGSGVNRKKFWGGVSARCVDKISVCVDKLFLFEDNLNSSESEFFYIIV